MSEETTNMEATEQAEDLLPVESTEPTEDNSEDLASLLTGEDAQPTEEQTGDSQGTRQEPGYVRGRIDRAVAKAVAETEARMKADFEKQMAPYREQMITMEAQELVRTGTVKDLETAKELVRYRQGQPQKAAEPEAQPRDNSGRFAQKNTQPTSDPATSARIDMLQHQADRIRSGGGPDVIAEFKNNEEIKQKVIAGEMDFYDVADYMKQPQRRQPSPMRSSNGVSGTEKSSIAKMTDEQFRRLNKKLDEGAVYSLR